LLAAALGSALVASDGAVIHLGPGWPVGALVEFGTCMLPAQLIGCWTRDRTHVYGRVVLQLIEFTVLYLIVVTAMLVQTGGSWARVLAHRPLVNVLVIVLLAIPLLTIGWGGILEFPARGLGTPLPYDTAPRLLTSGPYAYIRNPVQLSIALLLVGVGAWLSSLIVVVVGILSVPISQILSDWDEIYEMPRRYGDEFRAYQRNVRRWLPSWYPWCPRTARLYIGAGGLAELARSIARGGVRGLDVVEINSRATLRYDPCDGLPEETDVVALARVMEHRHFAWALLGILIRLPPVRALARLGSGVRSHQSALARQP
jgi:protein-S-isoprenylcysteine O-methyltransferase Ste14